MPEMDGSTEKSWLLSSLSFYSNVFVLLFSMAP
jgi:hypothetical protein